MRRFWTETDIAGGADGFSVRLDGKIMRLPGGGNLVLPFAPLARAIAEEWGMADTEFTLEDLPLTRLAATARERVHAHREDIAGQLAAYGMNDLLCYRATDGILAEAEHAAWQPWLDWAAARYGIRLLTTTGIIPVTQNAETHAALVGVLSGMTDYHLAGLGVIVPALGSCILGLAVRAGALEPAEACALAHLDELHQEKTWGIEDEAAARRHAVVTDVAVAARFMVLCGP